MPNLNGNDLVFNKTVLIFSDSISIAPVGKTWKLESLLNNVLLTIKLMVDFILLQESI